MKYPQWLTTILLAVCAFLLAFGFQRIVSDISEVKEAQVKMQAEIASMKTSIEFLKGK